MKRNVVKEKTYAFSVKVIRLCQYLQSEKKEFILSKQLIRSGTNPGAMVREAEHAQSRKDFVHKMSIGLKEINESEYWIDLLYDTGYISKDQYDSIMWEAKQVLKLMIAIVKTTREKMHNG
jgi:four helix bundle protein